MNTYSKTLYKVKETKNSSKEVSQSQYRDIRPSSLGQVQTKVEKKNKRDELIFFCERELETRGDVEDDGANWRNSGGGRFHKAGAVW